MNREEQLNMNGDTAEPAGSDEQQDRLSSLVASILLNFAGNGGVSILPVLVGAYVDDLGYSEKAAGLLGSAEMVGFALGSFATACVVHRWDRRRLGLVILLALLVGNVMSLMAAKTAALVAARALSGVGGGGLVALVNASVAGSRNPERRFGVVMLFTLVFAGACVAGAAALSARLGADGVFLGLIAAALVSSVMLPWLPRFGPQARQLAIADALRDGRPVAVLLVGYLFLYIAHMAVWTYQERIGVAIGLTSADAGVILGLAAISGVAGSGIAAVLGQRFGRAWPQIVSLTVSAAAALLLVYSHSGATYILVAHLIMLSWFYGLPYFIGLMAWVDPSGRVAALGATMFTVGAIIGPLAAALLISPGHYTDVGWLGTVLYVICLALVLPIAHRVDRATRNRADA